VSVWVIEQLIEALVDNILRVVDKEQWEHILKEVGDVSDVSPPMLGLIFVQQLNGRLFPLFPRSLYEWISLTRSSTGL
jgi:hypothetical protein